MISEEIKKQFQIMVDRYSLSIGRKNKFIQDIMQSRIDQNKKHEIEISKLHEYYNEAILIKDKRIEELRMYVEYYVESDLKFTREIELFSKPFELFDKEVCLYDLDTKVANQTYLAFRLIHTRNIRRQENEKGTTDLVFIDRKLKEQFESQYNEEYKLYYTVK